MVLLKLALSLICNMLSEKVRAAIETELRGEMFGGLLSTELSDISGYHTAELVNRMFSDVRICAEGAANILPSAVNLVTQLLCAGVLMIVLQPWFAAVFAAAASAERIMEIERLPHEENSAGTRGEFTELRVDGVRFSYGGGDVLTRADMTVKRGEIAALTGISGGGKTTLFILIFGMYCPQAGK